MNPTDKNPDHDAADAFISAALSDACNDAEATDLELALAAQSGISAIPSKDRDRVLDAIASNNSGALGAPALHAVLEREPAESSPSLRLSGTSSTRRNALYRVGQLGFAVAASLTLLFTVQLANLPQSEPGLEDTPLNAGSTNQDQTIDDPNRQQLLKALMAFSGAGACVMLAVVFVARRSKSNES